MPTVCLRAGCVTGPQHASAALHGFLAYLMKCTATATPTPCSATAASRSATTSTRRPGQRDRGVPRTAPACCRLQHRRGRESNVSILEAIELCQAIAGRELDYTVSEEARIGDHRWWISSLAEFESDHPPGA